MQNMQGQAAPDDMQRSEMVDLQKRWMKDINSAEKYFQKWERRAKKIVRRYILEYSELSVAETARTTYPILWSNMETLEPAVYTRPPQPVAVRRFRDQDPVAREAGEVIERASTVMVEKCGLDEMMRSVRKDFLLVGRGTAWFRYRPRIESVWVRVPLAELPNDYEPVADADPMAAEQFNNFTDRPNRDIDTSEEENKEVRDNYLRLDTNEPCHAENVMTDPMTGQLVGEVLEERLTGEGISCDYVAWQDFLHEPARVWREVNWVARKVYLSKREVQDRFGRQAAIDVGYDFKPSNRPVSTSNGDASADDKATIYEIWSREDKKIYFIAKDCEYCLEARDPFLDLSGFFPCPAPCYTTKSNEALIPTPDFDYYQTQAIEIDRLTARIRSLLDQLKVNGFYPQTEDGGAASAIQTALQPGIENKMFPIANWSSFTEKGGAGAVQWMPIDVIQKVLAGCIEARRIMIEDIYQITGISDILRGDTQASETATAQSIKAQWGSVRIRQKQQELANFAKNSVVIIAEIIAAKFQPNFIGEMANKQVTPEVMDLLRNSLDRQFRIDIETDSTIAPDEQQEKQSRMEFVTTMSGFMTQIGQMMLEAPQIAPMVLPLTFEMMNFAIRGFRVGRELEEKIEQTEQKLLAALSQPQGEQEDPSIATAKIKADTEIYKTNTDAALQARAQDLDHHRQIKKQEQDHAVAQFASVAKANAAPQRQRGEVENLPGMAELPPVAAPARDMINPFYEGGPVLPGQ